METNDCILTRRSIRRFIDKEISDETIKKIAELTTFAPSWKNSQTTRYIAVKNKDLKDKIANDCLNGFTWNKNIIDSANTLIVELTINNIAGYNEDKTPTSTKGSHWQSFDAGLSAQTFCLAANDMGIGSVIMGLYNEEAVKKELNIDDKYSVSALIAIGYHDQTLNAPDRVNVDEFLTIK
ncbi:MAG: nitroreductase family protein [Candidatus Gastranaerophilales bacterium]|nr:nitroreductase family protein [Candidatus Gastranaerophilales bacterium]